MMMAYLRSILKISFFEKNENFKKSILLTKPVSIFYERYCVHYYLLILE